MIGAFKPVTGVIRTGSGHFALPGNNAGFCNAILRKSGTQAPLHLESLTYVRPADREDVPQAAQQPLVVNLLVQLRAYCHQSNTFLRNQAALNLQLTQQLQQVLTLSGSPVRLRAGEIERAVRKDLYREGQFQRALEGLIREVKKNDHRTPELTARLPGPGTAAGADRGHPPRSAPGAVSGERQRETPVLRASVFPSVPSLPPLAQLLPAQMAEAAQLPSGKEETRPKSAPSRGEEAPAPKKGRSKKAVSQSSTREAKEAPRKAAGETTAELSREGAGNSGGRVGRTGKKPEKGREGANLSPRAAGEQPAEPIQAEPMAPLVRAEQATRPAQAGQAIRPVQTEQAARPIQTERTTGVVRAEQAIRLIQTEQIARLVRAEQPAGLAQTVQAARLIPGGQMVWPVQTERVVPGILGLTIFHNTTAWTRVQTRTTEMMRSFLVWRRQSGMSDEGADVSFAGKGGRTDKETARPLARMGERSAREKGTAPRQAQYPLQDGRNLPSPTSSHEPEHTFFDRQSFRSERLPTRAVPTVHRADGLAPGSGRAVTARLPWYTQDAPIWGFRRMAPEVTRRGGLFRYPAAVTTASGGSVPHLAAQKASYQSGLFRYPAAPTTASGGFAPYPAAEEVSYQSGLFRYPMAATASASGGAPYSAAQGRHSTAALGSLLYALPIRGTEAQIAFADGRGGLAGPVRPVLSPQHSFSQAVRRQQSTSRGTAWTQGVVVPEKSGERPAGGLRGERLSRLPLLRTAANGLWAGRPGRTDFLPGGLPAHRGRQGRETALASPEGLSGIRYAADSGSGLSADRDFAEAGPVDMIFPNSRLGERPGAALPTAGGVSPSVPRLTGGVGRRLTMVQRAVRKVLSGEDRGTWTVVGQSRQVIQAIAELNGQMARLERPAAAPPAGRLRLTVPGRSGGEMAILPTEEMALPIFRTPERSSAAEQTGAAGGGRGSRQGQAPAPPMIHRKAERPAAAQETAGADSGEAVLQAQTVSPAKAAAMNAAFSYPPGQTGRSAPGPETLTAEQEERITQRVLEDINYNRMADEVLDRVERRLRAERRKFGR